MTRYLKAAFNARPLGMFVPPNWVGLAVFALLGALVNPGFLAIGAGLELAYLFVLATNGRFQRLVDARQTYGQHEQKAAKLRNALAELGRDEQAQYRALEQRCRIILNQQSSAAVAGGDLQTQSQGLGRLLWIYLRLLTTRQALVRVLREAGSIDEPLETRVAKLGRALERDLEADLRRSYEGQMDILRQRLARQEEAKRKLDYLQAELSRIEQQVELIREQSVLSSDPQALSHRIDEIGGTLSGTNEWLRDQQRVYGSLGDLLEDAPPLDPEGSRPQAADSRQQTAESN